MSRVEPVKKEIVVNAHRNLERYGEQALKFRGAVDSPGGWPKILEEFAKTTEAS